MTRWSAQLFESWCRWLDMRALALSTRYREGAFEGDACLLVYDETELSAAMVSSDVRDVLSARPNTWKIYVLAPFLDEATVVRAALEGSAFERAAGKKRTGMSGMERGDKQALAPGAVPDAR